MKAFSFILLVGIFCCLGSLVQAQVTNLVVNSASANFTMTAGDTIHWEYNLSVGGTAGCELWLDANNNGTIEPGTDVQRFFFNQIDGDTSSNGGPSDLDKTVNGHILFVGKVGLPPGKFIF